MKEELRADLLFLINNIYPADFMLVMLVFFLAIVLLIFLILARDSKFMVFLLLLFIVVGVPAVGIIGEIVIDKVARNRELSKDAANYYEFSKSLNIAFTLKNNSKNTFNFCKVAAKLYAKSDVNASKIIKFKNDIQVLRLKSISLKNELKPQKSVSSRIIFKNFDLKIPYEIRLSSICF